MKTQFFVLFTITTLCNLDAMETQSQQNLNNALYNATHSWNEKEVIQLLELGADPNARCPRSTEWAQPALASATALICAASHGSKNICTLLLDAGADPSLRDQRGRNALIHAMLQNHKKTFFLLLNHPKVDAAAFYDLDDIQEYWLTMSPYFMFNNLKKFTAYIDAICTKWIEDKVDLTQTTQSKMTLLHYMARWGSPDLCEHLITLLKSIGASIDPRNSLQETPLHIVGYNQQYTCEVLLAHGADANALAFRFGDNQQDESKGITPLDSRDRCDSRIGLLLDYGADVFRQTTMKGKLELHIKKIYLQSEINFARIVLAPPAQTLLDSQQKIKTFLLCCNRLWPTLPRDIRNLLLCTLPTNDLGNCMIARRLKGLPIPILFLDAATHALYDHTYTQLKCHVAQYEPDYLKKYDFRHEENQLTTKNFDSYLEGKIRQNVIARLTQDKLLCNNPRQATEFDCAAECDLKVKERENP